MWWDSSTIKSDLFVRQFKIKNTKCKYSKFIFRQALVKGIESPYRPVTGHECCRRFKLPDFDTVCTWRWYGCEPYAPAAFTSQEIFMTLICVRGCVEPRAIVLPEGLRQWKIPIAFATFRLVAQCLYQLRHHVPILTLVVQQILANCAVWNFVNDSQRFVSWFMRTDAWTNGAVSKGVPQVANAPKRLLQTCCCDHISFLHVQRLPHCTLWKD